MLSFDQLVADRDALKAQGADTTKIDNYIAQHKSASDVERFKDQQAQERGEK